MSDISYKKFSELAATTSLIAADVIPVVTTTGGNNSKQITYGSFAQTVSSTLIGPFTTTITAVEPVSAGKWNSTYTTVNANSAVWGTGGSTSGFTIFKQISSVASPNDSTTVHALSIISSQTNVDVAVLSKGTGATLAQIPDNTSVANGSKRGIYATDWQKSRSSSDKVASGAYSTIGGGYDNTAAGVYSTVGGGSTNTAATGANSTVGGGTTNTATGANSTIGGGSTNTASGPTAVVGGGFNNNATGEKAAIGGGDSNYATGTYTTVAGGYGNTASGTNSTVGGGRLNNATGTNSTVVGGNTNTASGTNSTIVGGTINYDAGLSNTFIIGSNITAVSADYTYVNNISSQGTVAANNFKYSTSTATFASGPIFIDAAQAQLHHITYTGSTTPVDLHISNIYNTPGRDVKIHIVNRAAAGRVLTPKYVSTSPAITGGIPLTTTGIVASAANTGSMATNAIATIWVANIGGNIVGSFS
jgi:hypothetical protein